MDKIGFLNYGSSVLLFYAGLPGLVKRIVSGWNSTATGVAAPCDTTYICSVGLLLM